LLESTAKEYPAGLIADDGRAQAVAPDFKHIGPIDPDAFTLNQFLKSLAIRATRMFSWTAERFMSRSCALRHSMHRPGHKRQLPIAGRVTKNVTLISDPNHSALLMPKLNAREDSCLF